VCAEKVRDVVVSAIMPLELEVEEVREGTEEADVCVEAEGWKGVNWME
jgi:hypothetical protein